MELTYQDSLLEVHEFLIRECIAILGPVEVKRIHNPLKLNAYIFIYVLFVQMRSIELLKFSEGLVVSSLTSIGELILNRRKLCYQKF